MSSSFVLPLSHRGLRTSASAWDAVDVKVPAMGESVTEGTIASVLKKTGGCTTCMGTARVGAGLQSALRHAGKGGDSMGSRMVRMA